MSSIQRDNERKGSKKVNVWLVIGAIVLIVLLMVWLTVAEFTGDTDVAAFIPSAAAILG